MHFKEKKSKKKKKTLTEEFKEILILVLIPNGFHHKGLNRNDRGTYINFNFGFNSSRTSSQEFKSKFF